MSDEEPFTFAAESSDAACDGVLSLLRSLTTTLSRPDFDQARFRVRIEIEEVDE